MAKTEGLKTNQKASVAGTYICSKCAREREGTVGKALGPCTCRKRGVRWLKTPDLELAIALPKSEDTPKPPPSATPELAPDPTTLNPPDAQEWRRRAVAKVGTFRPGRQRQPQPQPQPQQPAVRDEIGEVQELL